MNYFYHKKKGKYYSVEVVDYGRQEELFVRELNLKTPKMHKVSNMFKDPIDIAGAMVDNEIRHLTSGEEAKLRLLFGGS